MTGIVHCRLFPFGRSASLYPLRCDPRFPGPGSVQMPQQQAGLSGSGVVPGCASPAAEQRLDWLRQDLRVGRTEPLRATPGFSCSSDTAQGHCLTFKSCSKPYSIFIMFFNIILMCFVSYLLPGEVCIPTKQDMLYMDY